MTGTYLDIRRQDTDMNVKIRKISTIRSKLKSDIVTRKK